PVVQRKKSYMMMLSIIITGIALASAGTITRTVIDVLPSSLATSKSNQSVNVGVLLYNIQTLQKIW
ncbi:MAG TPA: hypothetical protein VFI70_13960, partial [Nitrososphaeraceae archaeon]|nr:hypothetical protein [Nitrososphaeraceae archaeon]